MDVEKKSSYSDLPKIRSLPSWFVWACATLCLVSGVWSSMAFKLMNRMDAPVRSGDDEKFAGAVLQSFLMFIGEMLCFVVWWVDNVVSKRQGYYPLCDFVKTHSEMDGKTSYWAWWTLPAFLDCVATTLMNVAYQFTYASTVQMLRNFMVVIGAILQLVLVRKALRIHEYMGVILITGAMFLAAVPAIRDPDDTNPDAKPALGIVFALLGTSIQALQLIFEDYLFRHKGRMSPLKAVGIEGAAGLVITCAIMMPACEYTDFDPVWDSFHQWGNNGTIIGVSVVYIVFGALLFNASGLSCTKLASGLLRGVIFAVRAPIVWFIELALTWISYDSYNLAAVFVFALGFALFTDMIPWEYLLCKTDAGRSFDRWGRRAPQWCCTRPELDDDYVADSEPNTKDAVSTAINEPEV